MSSGCRLVWGAEPAAGHTPAQAIEATLGREGGDRSWHEVLNKACHGAGSRQTYPKVAKRRLSVIG